MSKLFDFIQVGGGSKKYLDKSLQVLQNRAARAVTGKSWFTPVRRLLNDCNWLSVNQLIFYQTVLKTQKVLISGRPLYLQQRFSTLHPYKTRQAAGGSIWHGESPSMEKSFTHRAAHAYNTIPSHIRTSRTLPTFKFKLKKWVAANIPID